MNDDNDDEMARVALDAFEKGGLPGALDAMGLDGDAVSACVLAMGKALQDAGLDRASQMMPGAIEAVRAVMPIVAATVPER